MTYFKKAHYRQSFRMQVKSYNINEFSRHRSDNHVHDVVQNIEYLMYNYNSYSHTTQILASS